MLVGMQNVRQGGPREPQSTDRINPDILPLFSASKPLNCTTISLTSRSLDRIAKTGRNSADPCRTHRPSMPGLSRLVRKPKSGSAESRRWSTTGGGAAFASYPLVGETMKRIMQIAALLALVGSDASAQAPGGQIPPSSQLMQALSLIGQLWPRLSSDEQRIVVLERSLVQVQRDLSGLQSLQERVFYHHWPGEQNIEARRERTCKLIGANWEVMNVISKPDDPTIAYFTCRNVQQAP